MGKAAPFAALGLLVHPSVVGMEGCLLAMKDIPFLIRSYAFTGTISLIATQLLLRANILNIQVTASRASKPRVGSASGQSPAFVVAMLCVTHPSESLLSALSFWTTLCSTRPS